MKSVGLDPSPTGRMVGAGAGQKGVVLRQAGTQGKDAAGMVRGYVAKDRVTR